ncbi:MAG TPA: hypothetical protein VKR60_05220 [Candidatus Sulfotelmatobacter sp.]|nr:hypothetical protein [Candidatus Sulfotelmatobacter sp.]
MNGKAPRFIPLGVGLVGLIALGCVLTGQAAKTARHGIPLPTDWSHSHLIFSQPASVEQAMRLQEDPRFEQQLYRHYQALRLPAVAAESDNNSSQLRFPSRRHTVQGLWEEDLGTGASVGAGVFPAKFSFGSGVANCGSATAPDFVVYSTGLTGSGTQASIVAYDNLYAGCTGTIPSVYWAYNTGGQILTSPVFSRDGSQLAFAQTAGALGSLVLLKWAASTTETVALPGVPTSVLPAQYSACVAPCMTTIALEDGSLTPTDDTTSSVFYDYGSDTAWVGDSRSWLHQFTPVFLGTPAEIRTVSPKWPVQLNSTLPLPLATAVHDHVSGNVFVGDAGGFFYQVAPATSVVTKSSQLDFGTTGIVAGPLVDSTAGVEYVLAADDGSTACAGAPCAAVYRFASGFAAGTAGAKVTVGAGAANPKPLYDGTVDSAYLNSNNASGNLYVCGHTGGRPTLYQVQITAGVLGTVITGPVLTTAATACSTVTEVFNPNATGQATEYIFASVQTKATPTPCAGGGCIMNLKITPWLSSTAYTLGEEIVDSHFQIQLVTKAGTSGTSAPIWTTTSGLTTNDGTIKWLDLGLETVATPAGWQANHAYFLRNYIQDSNQNIEAVTNVAGDNLSGATQPTWPTAFGQVTVDNHVTWTNAGPAPSGLASSGGTSAVIIDNTVVSGVAGSQIYFSTQGNQACGTSGTGGCAVQASQSALK